jgi:hypothetical protein
MPLQTSGAISLSNVNVELGRSATALINMNESEVRTLAGVATGAITMNNFYGKSAVVPATTAIFHGGATFCDKGCAYSSLATRINSSGTLIGSETQVNLNVIVVGNTAAPVGGNGLFYAGSNGFFGSLLSRSYRISSAGAKVGSDVNIGTARSERLGGAPVGGNGLFYGGFGGPAPGGPRNIVTRISSTQTLVGSETNVGTERYAVAGAPVGGNGLFFGGQQVGTSALATCTRINSDGALVGSETTPTTATGGAGGAESGGNGIFWRIGNRYTEQTSNTVARINSNGALVGTNTTAGTSRKEAGSASVGAYAMFYGGGGPGSNQCTRVNSSGTLVGSQTNVGTGRYSLAGAGV